MAFSIENTLTHTRTHLQVITGEGESEKKYKMYTVKKKIFKLI